MTVNGILQLALYMVVLIALVKPLGTYMANYRMPIEDYLDAHIATCLFPHVRIADHAVLLLPDAEAYWKVGSRVGDYMKDDWDHSRWTSGRVVQADPGKAHVAITFDRFTKNETLLESQMSFYAMEKIDGRWGVRGRSSFAK